MIGIKTAFLFGAGASMDCGNIYPHKPPRGSKLYSCLKIRFPETWGDIPTKLDSLFMENFEDGMYSLWRDYSNISPMLLKQLGIYFSEFVPASKNEKTMYHKIIEKLTERGKNDTILTTLNYDCLLDGELGTNINYLFPPGKGCPLIKLHGSCNWFIDFGNTNKYVNFSPDVRIEVTPYSLNTQEKVKEKLLGDNPFHSVMCLYTKDKPAPLSPGFFEHLRKEWKDLIFSVEQIIIVGVKPYPSDTYIWNPLMKTKADIFYIGNKEEYEKWHKNSGREGKTIFLDREFSKGINKVLEKLN